MSGTTTIAGALRGPASAMLVLVLAACSAGESAQAVERGSQAADAAGSADAVQLGEVPAALDTATAARLSGAFRAAAERSLGAVVYVQVEQEQPAERRGIRIPFPFFDLPEEMDPRPRTGTGSGFIFDERGYVMTNHHVVRNARQVLVRLVDGREYTAEVVGSDPQTDVALLRIDRGDGDRFTVAHLGDSDALRVGDWVLALGNPLGLDFTVTAGIVSAKGRSIGILQREQDALALESFIQTDAAINRGNSGGPLVDLLGRVVGVNTAIASETGLAAGYGFAIPIALAAKVANDIMEHGAVRRPRLGVEIAAVTAADAEALGLDRISGALVRSVQPGTAAADAGIRMGDVILAVDGHTVRNSSELTARLARYQPGDRVRLSLIRDGRARELDIRLGQFEQTAARTPEPAQRPAAEELLGFRVAPLTRERAAQLGFSESGGVVITAVVRGSPAAAQLQPGLRLLRLNGESIRSTDDVDRIAERLRPGDVVSVIVRSPDGREQMINYRTRR